MITESWMALFCWLVFFKAYPFKHSQLNYSILKIFGVFSVIRPPAWYLVKLIFISLSNFSGITFCFASKWKYFSNYYVKYRKLNMIKNILLLALRSPSLSFCHTLRLHLFFINITVFFAFTFIYGQACIFTCLKSEVNSWVFFLCYMYPGIKCEPSC